MSELPQQVMEGATQSVGVKLPINQIPLPAPVKIETLTAFQDETEIAVVTEIEKKEETEFRLTTTLDMFEVQDVDRVRNALANARDKHFIDKEQNIYIFFARGAIDNWCAYVARKDSADEWHVYAPKDVFYFERVYYVAYMQQKAYPRRRFSPYHRLFNEIMHIAEIMFFDAKRVNPIICNEIDNIVDAYSSEDENYRLMLALSLYEIYYGMIAEENKEGTIVGRKIKMLGLYDLLIKQRGVITSCNLTRNMKVGIIESVCDKIGFAWKFDTDAPLDFVYQEKAM